MTPKKKKHDTTAGLLFAKSNINKPSKKILIKECDGLWSEIILRKAGFRSEISGLPGRQIDNDGHILQAHHIARKPNYRLRYELENGIALTIGEHKRGIHGTDEELYRERIKKVKGQDIYERMSLLRNASSPSLELIKIYLEQELLKYSDDLPKEFADVINKEFWNIV